MHPAEEIHSIYICFCIFASSAIGSINICLARGVEDGFGDGVQQKKQSFLAAALAVALPGRRVVLVIRLRFRIPIIFAVVVLGLLVIPQTIFRLRGSGGVGKKGLWFVCGSVRATRALSNISFYMVW